jgi:hypothetical protein
MIVPFSVTDFIERAAAVYGERVGVVDEPDQPASSLGSPTYAELYDLSPNAVLSIGDHFVNDIAPALDAGCATAYVDPFRVGPRGRATLEAPRFEELLAPIEDWVAARDEQVGTGSR